MSIAKVYKVPTETTMANLSGNVKTCSVCKRRPTVTFCTCSNPETLLCEQCCAPHITKTLGRVHVNLPIACYGNHKQTGFMERVQARSAELPMRVETLRQNLIKADECIALFTEKVEWLVYRVIAEAREITNELIELRRKLERDINTAVQEAEATIFDSEEPKICPLGKLLRNPAIPVDQLAVFSYKAEAYFSLPLRNFITYSLQNNSPIVSAIAGNTLKVHDLATGAVTETFTLSREFSEGTVFCSIDNTRILCIGGWNPCRKEVFWLHNSTQVSAAADKHITVSCPGVILIGTYVYSFGGYNKQEKLRESEKYSINENNWKLISPMSVPKCAFTPCRYASSIYLIELCRYLGSEKFDIPSETYTSITVPLPSSIVTNSYNALIGKEMVFLSSDMKVRRWNLETGKLVSANLTGVLPDQNMITNVSPVCWGNKVYFVQSFTGNLVTFDLLASTLA